MGAFCASCSASLGSVNGEGPTFSVMVARGCARKKSDNENSGRGASSEPVTDVQVWRLLYRNHRLLPSGRCGAVAGAGLQNVRRLMPGLGKFAASAAPGEVASPAAEERGPPIPYHSQDPRYTTSTARLLCILALTRHPSIDQSKAILIPVQPSTTTPFHLSSPAYISVQPKW